MQGQTINLRGATVIDGTGRDPLHNALVTIDNDRFTHVGINTAAGVRDSFDLNGLTITTGLIDAHSHHGIDEIGLKADLIGPTRSAVWPSARYPHGLTARPNRQQGVHPRQRCCNRADQLDPEHSPRRWSPDGRTLAFTTDRRQAGISSLCRARSNISRGRRTGLACSSW